MEKQKVLRECLITCSPTKSIHRIVDLGEQQKQATEENTASLLLTLKTT
jgi:hypothetical protein